VLKTRQIHMQKKQEQLKKVKEPTEKVLEAKTTKKDQNVLDLVSILPVIMVAGLANPNLLVSAGTCSHHQNPARRNKQIETELVQDNKFQGQVEVHASLEEVEGKQDQEEAVQVQTEKEITRDQDKDNQAEEEVEVEQAEGGTDQEEAQSGRAEGEMEEEFEVEDEERRAYSRRPGPTLNVLSQRIKNSRAIPENTPAPHDLRMLTAEEEQTRPSPNNSHPIPATKEKPSATSKNAARTTNNQNQVQACMSKQIQPNVITAK
jgi:hypothetical protein